MSRSEKFHRQMDAVLSACECDRCKDLRAVLRAAHAACYLVELREQSMALRLLRDALNRLNAKSFERSLS